jgi:tRNA nucleotidyltransferase (CCA-adding enzyme)
MSAGVDPRAALNSTAQVLDALPTFPGGAELAVLGERRGDLALVGGAVRDMLLGQRPRELDVVVEREAGGLGEELALLLQEGGAPAPNITTHERFGTAVVAWEGGRVDIAERRAESYPAPGALPRVCSGSVSEDLARRDFTVNAIAVALGDGQMAHVDHALEDLAARRLRVLHDESFIDDPTRLLRLARYSARLTFEPEPHTAALAAAALAAGALTTVSMARIGAELRLALAEVDPLAALRALADLGVLRAIEPRLSLDGELARAALESLPQDGRPDLLLMASLLIAVAHDDAQAVMYELLDGLEFIAADRQRAIGSALAAATVAEDLRADTTASERWDALHSQTVEAVALGAALSDSPAQARDWFQRQRHVRLAIGGDDLLAAGIPAGPDIGRRLAHVLALKLDGELPEGREAELNAALEA